MKTIRVCTVCLIGFLTAGAAIAWSTVALASIRFYRAEGTLLKVTNCRFPNPITTPYFYGDARRRGRGRSERRRRGRLQAVVQHLLQTGRRFENRAAPGAARALAGPWCDAERPLARAVRAAAGRAC